MQWEHSSGRILKSPVICILCSLVGTLILLQLLMKICFIFFISLKYFLVMAGVSKDIKVRNSCWIWQSEMLKLALFLLLPKTCVQKLYNRWCLLHLHGKHYLYFCRLLWNLSVTFYFTSIKAQIKVHLKIQFTFILD